LGVPPPTMLQSTIKAIFTFQNPQAGSGYPLQVRGAKQRPCNPTKTPMRLWAFHCYPSHWQCHANTPFRGRKNHLTQSRRAVKGMRIWCSFVFS